MYRHDEYYDHDYDNARQDVYHSDMHDRQQALMNEQIIDESREFLDAIVKQLYSKEDLNKGNLEHCIDELCHLLQVKMIKEELNIQRPMRRKPFFSDWVMFNNEQLKAS